MNTINGDLITGDTLQLIVPTLSPERALTIADTINHVCPGYGINSKDIIEEFLATVIHESDGFRIKEENLNYQTPAILVQNWPKHFPSVQFAKQYCGHPEKLANYIYGSTSIAKDLGNIKAEDGFAFRGSGFVQLTGRYSATAFAKYAGIETPEQAMELIRTDDRWAMESACWEFAIDKKLIEAAKADDFVKVTKRINGGLIGMKNREQIYIRLKKYLK